MGTAEEAEQDRQPERTNQLHGRDIVNATRTSREMEINGLRLI
jgi:hypothetical protein